MTIYGDKTSVREVDADGAYKHLVDHVLNMGDNVVFSNNVGTGKTLELRVTKMVFSGALKYITIREKFNLAFALAEVLWICQGRDDVEMLEFYNKQIVTYSDDQKAFNAAYGNRIFKL